MRDVHSIAAKAQRELQNITFSNIEPSLPSQFTGTKQGGWSFTKNSLADLPGLSIKNVEKAIESLMNQGFNFSFKQQGVVKGLELSLDDAVAICKECGLTTFKERFNNRCVVISVANLKGGVTKSSSTVHLGHALRTHKNRISDDLSILVIDLDPQASATMFLNREFAINDLDSSSIQALFHDLTFDELMADFIQPSQISGVDVMPASINDGFVASQLMQICASEPTLKDKNPLLLLKEHVIDKLRDHYDIILIDNGPHIDPLLQNTLCAVDVLLTPVPPSRVDYHSTVKYLIGLPNLYELINQNEQLVNPSIPNFGYMTKYVDGKKDHELIRKSAKQIFGSGNFIERPIPKLDGFERCGERFQTVISEGASTYEGSAKALNNAKNAAYIFAEDVFGKIETLLEDEGI